jgi:two-component system chemotaxis sensor kinase CheA
MESVDYIMNFKSKLYLGFGLILTLMVILAGSIVSILNDQNNQMNELVQDRYEKIKLANTVKHEVGITYNRLNNAISGDAPGTAQDDIVAVNQAKLVAMKASESLEEIVNVPYVRNLLNDFKVQFATYDLLLNQVIADIQEGNRTEATAELPKLEAIKMDLDSILDNVRQAQEQQMEETLNETTETSSMAIRIIIAAILLVLVMGIGITIGMIRSLTRSLDKVKNVMTNLEYGTVPLPRIQVNSNDEIGQIAIAFNEMTTALEEHAKLEKEHKQEIEEQNWLKTKFAEITIMYQGIQDLETLAQNFMNKVTHVIGASYGVFYIANQDKEGTYLAKLASFAANDTVMGAKRVRFGEGLLGQCAAEKRTILLDQIPNDYIKISSGLGDASPRSVIILPVQFEGKLVAVMEWASFERIDSIHETLLQQTLHYLGITINRIQGHMKIQELLIESQTLSEELQSQSEELQIQQEELKTINEELETQNKNAELRTKELEKTKTILEEKNRQIIIGSKYKSEFLANMSHELRTPLNSLLILAQMLVENKEGNLTMKQVEFASTIRSSGNDLLSLINDILDLSKIESGKMDVHYSEVVLEEIQTYAERHFLPIARHKGIEFIITVDKDLPLIMFTDEQRLQQILKNLLSNAFKFTEQGSVELHIRKTDITSFPYHSPKYAEWGVIISVNDTGIGISSDKQESIFDAFQQADGTTSRRYGGTGLGLSICRELAQLLGGFIEVQSSQGQGSTFTLYLPCYSKNLTNEWVIMEQEAAVTSEPSNLIPYTSQQQAIPRHEENEERLPHVKEVLEGKKILVIDDDMRNVFALSTALESLKMNVVFAENGKEGLEVLQDHSDIDLILMDIMMPEMDGYEAMQKIRHIPDYHLLPIIALTAKAMKDDRQRCIDAGASDYISKPVNLDQLLSLMRVWMYK